MGFNSRFKGLSFISGFHREDKNCILLGLLHG